MKRKKFDSLSRKLLALLTVLILLTTLFIGVCSYLKSSQIKENNFKAAADQAITQVQNYLNTYLHMREDSISILSKSEVIRNNSGSKSEDAIIAVLKDYQEDHKDIIYAYFGSADKKMIIYPETPLPESYDPTSRSWYLQAVSQDKVSWYEPYIDIGTGEPVVTVTIPVYNDNKEFVGVLGADITLAQLTDQIEETKFGQSGYFTLLDNNGLVIAHPDNKLLGNKLPNLDLVQAVSAVEKGNKVYIEGKRLQCVFFSTIEGTGWKLLGIFDYK